MWCKLSRIHSKRWTLLSQSHLFPDAWTSCLASYSPVRKFDQYLYPKELWIILKKLWPENVVKIMKFEAANNFVHIVVLLIHLLVQVDVLLLVISDLLQNLLQQLLWPSHPLFPKVCFKSLDLFGVDQGALDKERISTQFATKLKSKIDIGNFKLKITIKIKYFIPWYWPLLFHQSFCFQPYTVPSLPEPKNVED